MELNSERLYVICTISPTREVGQVELDLVPALIQAHWHCTDERFDSRCTLVV